MACTYVVHKSNDPGRLRLRDIQAIEINLAIILTWAESVGYWGGNPLVTGISYKLKVKGQNH